MTTLLDSITDGGRRLGAAATEARDVRLRSRPDWHGRDMLAHTCGFTRASSTASRPAR